MFHVYPFDCTLIKYYFNADESLPYALWLFDTVTLQILNLILTYKEFNQVEFGLKYIQLKKVYIM